MVRSSIERKLSQVGSRLKRLRGELAILDEQRIQLVDEADSARLKALVSETPLSERAHRSARRHLEVIERRRDDIAATITKLDTAQDELLDRLTEANKSQDRGATHPRSNC